MSNWPRYYGGPSMLKYLTLRIFIIKMLFTSLSPYCKKHNKKFDNV